MTRTMSFPEFATCAAIFAFSSFAAGASASGPEETVLYRFHGGADGNGPQAAMIADTSGNLYGTTNLGGDAASCPSGCGIVFELSPPAQRNGRWTEAVLYSFQGGSDGAMPQAQLIADAAGNLYGTTSQGGNGNCDNQDLSGCGTVFRLSPPGHSGGSWTETVMYSFQGNPNGNGNGDLAWPNGLVFDKAGNIDGLAYDGGHCNTDETGTYCYGGAFRLNKSSGWSEKVVYHFRNPSGGPAAPVLDGSGKLYGKVAGGAYGCGEVFSLTPGRRPEWTQTSLYDFRGGSDGAFPLPGLVFDAAGNLYGTSLGTAQEYGNVFELSPAREGGSSESVLYNFTQLAKGYTPNGGPLIGEGGKLYGTTEEGGQSDEGTVFRLTPPQKRGRAWTERVLHSFAQGRGGFAPYGGLTLGKGNTVYGTTPVGGVSGCGNGFGCGTVFRIDS